MLTEEPTDDRTHFQVFQATGQLFSGELSADELHQLLDRVSATHELFLAGTTCLLLGCGSQMRGVYQELRSMEGVEVVWDGAYLPIWLYPLRLFAAAHGGLVQVKARLRLVDAFIALADNAVVQLGWFTQPLMPKLVRHFRKDARHCRITADRVIGSDPSYFLVGADGKDPDAPDGYQVWASHGHDCPSSFRTCINPFVSRGDNAYFDHATP